MSSGSSYAKAGKRKRSELEDIENVRDSSWADKAEHRRKRVRESPPTSPPLTPLPTNSMLSSESECELLSSPRRWSSCSVTETRSKTTALEYLNRGGVVELMCQVDSRSDVIPDFMSRHEGLTPRMRSVLLDWLMEVCEAYHLHRDTYYLALNYLDRYLSQAKKIFKTQLQLIGITCLFIAAKVEEIYPPKLSDFSYVTNDACSQSDIVAQELVILDKLQWNINALTVHGWLGFFLQYWNNRDAPAKTIIVQNLPTKEYLAATQLIDLATMDCSCNCFPYIILAAAAVQIVIESADLSSFLPLRLATEDKQLLAECVLWLTPFAETLRSKGNQSPRAHSPRDINKQSHSGDLKLLEIAQDRLKQLRYSSVVMTPPSST